MNNDNCKIYYNNGDCISIFHPPPPELKDLDYHSILEKYNSDTIKILRIEGHYTDNSTGYIEYAIHLNANANISDTDENAGIEFFYKKYNQKICFHFNDGIMFKTTAIDKKSNKKAVFLFDQNTSILNEIACPENIFSVKTILH